MTDLREIIDRLENVLTDLKVLESHSVTDVTHSPQDWTDFWENTDE